MFEGLALRALGRLRATHVPSLNWRKWFSRKEAAPQSPELDRPWPDASTRAGAPLFVADLALIREDLRHMLDRHVLARRVLRHLASVEQALTDTGAKAFDHLPLPLVQRALDQLEAFVDDWTPRGLAELRLRLTFAQIMRVKNWTREGRDSVLSAFWVDSRLQVNEASLSAFDNAAINWPVRPK